MDRPIRNGESLDSGRHPASGILRQAHHSPAAAITWLSFFVILGMLISTPARAECGGNINCIAVSINPAVQPSHGTPLVSAPLGFGSQIPGTTSAASTILVRHVGGVDGLATLQSITLGGADANEFSLAGGDCVIGIPSLPRNGPSCTILITFNPTSAGLKNAAVAVTSPRITRTVPLTGFGDDGTLPDPAEDTILPGLTRNQTDTARRFSSTQIANIQHRLESLRGSRQDSTAETTLASRENQTLIAQTLVQLASNGSISLAALDNAEDSSASVGGDRWWVAGDLFYGTRNDSESGSDWAFSSDGISIGFDKQFRENLAFGLSAGFAESDSDVSSNPSSSNAESISLAAYASYRPAPGTFIDGLIGFGELSFDTERFDIVANRLASSSRDGSQLFASIAAGYELRQNELLFQPYARADITRDELDSVTETGVGALNLRYDEESLQTVRIALGILAEAPHTTSYGWILPRLRLELQYEDESDADATVSYAGQGAGSNFSIVPSDRAEQTLLLGVGGILFFRNGLQLDVEYRGIHASGSEASQLISLNLSGSLDGTSVAIPLETAASATPIRAEFGYSRVTNINQANEGHDKLDDNVVEVVMRKQQAYGLSRLTRVMVTSSLSLTDHREHQGLDHISGSLQGEYQYRGSSRFTASTFGVYGRTAIDGYESDLRGGWRAALGLKWHKPLTTRIELFTSLESRSRDADNAVFDTDNTSLRLFADYRLSRASIFSLGFELRDGDSVSSAQGSNSFSTIADEVDSDDAYHGVDLFAYRFETETEILTLAYNLRLGPQDSLDISLQSISAEPGDAPPGIEVDYESQRLSVFYLIRF